jgi:hypothetical protein
LHSTSNRGSQLSISNIPPATTTATTTSCAHCWSNVSPVFHQQQLHSKMSSPEFASVHSHKRRTLSHMFGAHRHNVSSRVCSKCVIFCYCGLRNSFLVHSLPCSATTAAASSQPQNALALTQVLTLYQSKNSPSKPGLLPLHVGVYSRHTNTNRPHASLLHAIVVLCL